MTPHELLKKHWNHDQFRDPQLQIITSVLDGHDTFALLPTGGGKSICFQIPALMKPGICLVVSPLIALMKDQVANLQKRDLKALSLTGGITQNETIELLDNAQFGNYKFLYLSPERLQSEWIVERIKNLPINLIAIDEAHCVSQWGHDFRPAYLKIAMLKTHFPKIPFLALTASATDRVRQDIAEQLQLEAPAVFQISFARDNLAYMVFETEDKLLRIEQILRKNPEPAIIYVRNRKSCIDVSAQLRALGFTATFYHGGLTQKEKNEHMQLWMDETVQVIVATNAFGMGIDKANVKTVIHSQLPDNLENYYQEAGRAGRNGQKAFAVLLTAPSDLIQAENQFLAVLPDRKFLLEVYVKLCNYFQIAYGEGIDEHFSFNLNQFCLRYDFAPAKTYNALQFLDRQGVIALSQEFSQKIALQFLIESREVMRYISLNPSDEDILLTILRTYPGIYELQTAFNAPLIAKKSGRTEAEVYRLLDKLAEKSIIDYHARNNDAAVTFNEIREDEKTINRVAKYLENQNALKKAQLESVVRYVSNNNRCKQQLLLDYFGEIQTRDCGICSYCIGKQKKPNPLALTQPILQLLKTADLDSREIHKMMADDFTVDASDVIFALQMLLENEVVALLDNNKYTLIK
ncbi:RecQ family ATP-dependent DNA helicase [Flavobacterium caeni]|uniref:ATP-dependent DNA helicase RecQ n=1 Tax=Flavobacterium caeni TaxID=490189 RepID=A0A1G5HKH7_9FLAO|nr:ATP-dependent DNA helicase RecQ [Flavobacterium caeni]SCY64392.1 ATP-dependent DNA helicase RecQ [Flavobacterium caeni]